MADGHARWTGMLLLWLGGLSSASATDLLPELLLVELNGVPDEQAIWLLGARNEWWAPAERFTHWRLRLPDDTPSLQHEGDSYLPLHVIDGVRLKRDRARQVLVVTVPARALQPFDVDASFRDPPLRLSRTLSGFINYDVSASRVGGIDQQAAVVEVGVSGEWGSLVGSGYVNHTPSGHQATRLDTAWTLDDADEMTTLRVGDAITRAGSWGRAARFGGIQYATNFATQPGFVTFPLPTLRGEAAVPSTVDLLINSSRRIRQDVPTGPFTLNNVPVISGQNQIQFIVRDVLGRERLVTQSFYSAPLLLRPGLDDFSFEAGALRRNYGREDSRYDEVVASATYRRGFRSGLTGEIRGEAGQGLAAAGIGVDGILGDWASAGMSLAASTSPAGAGMLAGARFERRQRRGLSFTLQSEVASSAFRQLGLADDANDAMRRRMSASVSAPIGRNGSVSASYVVQRTREGPTNELVSATWTQLLGRRVALSVSVIGIRSPVNEMTVFGMLTIPFENQLYANVTTAFRRNESGQQSAETTVGLQRALPVGPGMGYRVSASDNGNFNGTITLQSDLMAGSAEVAETDGTSGVRFGLTGSIGFVGTHMFASRRITDSFALVSVDGQRGVGVRVDNQLVARTDEHGYAIVPRLRAYDRNAISIDTDTLPIDAIVTQLRLDATPGFRSGVVVNFRARSGNSATVYLRRPDGTAVTAGATLTLIDEGHTFPVGFDGMSFVVGIDGPRQARVDDGVAPCRVLIPGPTGSDASVLICKEIE